MLLLLLGWADPSAVAQAIDREVAKRLDGAKTAPRASDAEFLRRVHLDLTGRPPTISQARAFLDSTDGRKRAKLVDSLLASKEYGEHFGRIWQNRMVRPDANMPRPPDPGPLGRWLAAQFNEGRGWDAIVRELLTASGPLKDKPQGLFFILNGDTRGNPQANIIAGSVGSLFMGTQLACAECHKHPFTETSQADFWGVAAFFGHIHLAGKDGVVETRKPTGKRTATIKTGPGASLYIPDTSFKGVGTLVKARVPGGKEAEGDGPYRPAFAEWLAAKGNPWFARNAANRLWGHVMGRGLVHPMDDLRDENPPSHPAILDLLTRELEESSFDLKHLIRCVCLSEAYGRTSAGNSDAALFARMEPKVMGPEALHDALCSALEVPAIDEAVVKRGKVAPMTGREAFIRAFSVKEERADAAEHAYGIPQALRLINQPLLNNGGKIAERVAKLGPEAAVEELYLAALSRRPTKEEADEASAFVRSRKTPRAGYAGVLWALLNSAEFILVP